MQVRDIGESWLHTPYTGPRGYHWNSANCDEGFQITPDDSSTYVPLMIRHQTHCAGAGCQYLLPEQPQQTPFRHCRRGQLCRRSGKRQPCQSHQGGRHPRGQVRKHLSLRDAVTRVQPRALARERPGRARAFQQNASTKSSLAAAAQPGLQQVLVSNLPTGQSLSSPRSQAASRVTKCLQGFPGVQPRPRCP